MMISDETTPNLLASPKVETITAPIAVGAIEDRPRPPRLGREATPLILPTSFRIKRMRRSHKRRLVLYSSVGAIVLLAALSGVVFAFRDRIQERLFTRPAATSPPSARQRPGAARPAKPGSVPRPVGAP